MYMRAVAVYVRVYRQHVSACVRLRDVHSHTRTTVHTHLTEERRCRCAARPGYQTAFGANSQRAVSYVKAQAAKLPGGTKMFGLF